MFFGLFAEFCLTPLGEGVYLFLWLFDFSVPGCWAKGEKGVEVISVESLQYRFLSYPHARTAPSLSTIHSKGRKTRTRLWEINQHKDRRVFSELACLGAFLRAVLVMLMTRRLEIEAPILILLTVLRAGVPIMTSNGKSRFNQETIG